MKQKIEVDENGCLMVYTDNGTIKKGETTTEIQGEFYTSAETVAKLLSIVNGENAVCLCSCGRTWLLVNDEKVGNEIKYMQEEVDSIKKEYEKRELDFIESLYSCLETYYKYKYPQSDAPWAFRFGDTRQGVSLAMSDLMKENKELTDEVKTLRKQIADFNASRRIWERKFDLE